MSLTDAVRVFRDYVKNLPGNLQFSVDKAAGYTVFKVVNPLTDEVIRQFPPEEILQMARKLRAMESQDGGAGILLDQES